MSEIRLNDKLSQAVSCELSHWAVFNINGADAETFLQGQFTIDVTTLTATSANWAAYANAQGRVVATFFIWRDELGFNLLCPRDILPVLSARLKKYALFSKVVMKESDSPWYAHINQSHQSGITLGNTELCINQYANTTLVDESVFDLAMVIHNFAVITPATTEHFVAQRLNLDTLGAISFKKGCYVGQEIIARLHYRGKAKHHTYQLTIATNTPLPAGSEIKTDKVIGHIVQAVRAGDEKTQALAVLADAHHAVTAADFGTAGRLSYEATAL